MKKQSNSSNINLFFPPVPFTSSLLIFQPTVSLSILNMQTNPHGHTCVQVSKRIRITHINALYMEIFLVTQNGSFHCLTVNLFLIKPDNTSFCCFSRLLAGYPHICTSCIYKYTDSKLSVDGNNFEIQSEYKWIPCKSLLFLCQVIELLAQKLPFYTFPFPTTSQKAGNIPTANEHRNFLLSFCIK